MNSETGDDDALLEFSLLPAAGPMVPVDRSSDGQKSRHPQRQRNLPENLLSQQKVFILRVQEAVLTGRVHGNPTRAFDPLERVLMIYRDALDGAVLTDDDTRTTSQLLGNPAIRQFQSWCLRLDSNSFRALEALDLERQKSLLPGPYLWFNFISRAVAHSVARLIIDYNRHAVPLADRELLIPAEWTRLDEWLNRPQEVAQNPPEDQGVETQEGEVRDQEDQPPAQQSPEYAGLDQASGYVTTAFTAIHFLDGEPHRDQEVADRFGPEVLKRLQRDRSLLIRRVFGTFPLHNRPKDERVLNLYAFYESWLSGGRLLFLPIFIVVFLLRQAYKVMKWAWRSIREVQNPKLRVDPVDAAQADFGTACRKIDRMRAPVTLASIRLRAVIDPEYLGLAIPGLPANTLKRPDLEADLEFLDADPWLIETMQEQRKRAEADMRRLKRLLVDGLLRRLATRLRVPLEQFDVPERRRAVACAYLADLRGVRRHLSARAIVQEVFNQASREDPLPMKPWVYWLHARRFRKYWAEYGFGGRTERQAAWRALVHNVSGVADALRVWSIYGDESEATGELILIDLLRHPSRITEQLVTLRTLQTLSVMDILTYRQHVFELGNYAGQGDHPDELLHWGAVRLRGSSVELAEQPTAEASA